MSNGQGKSIEPLPTVLPDRKPFAEELYLLDLVLSYKPTKAKPFMLVSDIEEAMKPHPAACSASAWAWPPPRWRRACRRRSCCSAPMRRCTGPSRAGATGWRPEHRNASTQPEGGRLVSAPYPIDL